MGRIEQEQSTTPSQFLIPINWGEGLPLPSPSPPGLVNHGQSLSFSVPVLKSVVPAAAKATFMTLFFWTGVNFLLAISVPCRFTLEVFQKSKVEELCFEPKATLWQYVSTGIKRGLQKLVMKQIEYGLLRCSGLHMCPHVSFAVAYLFFTKWRNWVWRDPFSEEKLHLKCVQEHLDRRSPMFAEKGVLNCISHIQWNWWNHRGIYSKSWSSEGSQNQVELAHAEKDAKTAFTKHRWA